MIQSRVQECRERWTCQVCGDVLPEVAWVVLEYGDMIVGGAALHRRCLKLSQRWCPYLADRPGDHETVEIGRDGLVPTGAAPPSPAQ